MTADGLTLFFNRSDTSGPGTGSNDVWFVTRPSAAVRFGEGGPPAQLAVGTPYDDGLAWISADGRFLFVSDWLFQPRRPGGAGSLDIWVAFRAAPGQPFSDPVNVNDLWPGTMVNTEFGEEHPRSPPTGRRTGPSSSSRRIVPVRPAASPMRTSGGDVATTRARLSPRRLRSERHSRARRRHRRGRRSATVWRRV